ncbi:MAG: glycosyltransferase family 39 protein [Acidobacteria bacterium]|nr:glycosyltransferase family 39 protein [Acidobacteriota bacterium]
MPADLAGGLGAVALFAVPGYGLTELLPTLRRRPLPRRAAYGYLLGVAAVAGGLYALSHCCGVPLRPPAVWATAAAPALAGLAAGLVRRRRARTRTPPRGLPVPPPPRGHWGLAWVRGHGGPLPAACLLAAAFLCLGVFAEAVTNPTHDWDGRMTWGAQARYVRAEGTVDAGVLRDARWYITHPQYPLLLPVAQVAVLEAFAADPDAALPRALYAAFLPALLLIAYDGARRAAGPAAGALAALTFAAAPFVIHGEGGAESTYSDLPLACFYGAALVLLLGGRPRTDNGCAAGLLLGAAVLTKNEGAVLAAMALALGWRAGRQGVAARFAAAAAPVVMALALFASWRAGIPNRQDESYPDIVQAGHLWPGIVTHVADFGPVLIDKMTDFRHWAGFWWMAAAALAAGRRALRHPLARRYLAASAAPPAVAWAAYSIHPKPISLAAVTWERFLLQAAVPSTIVLACALAGVWRAARPIAKPAGPSE